MYDGYFFYLKGKIIDYDLILDNLFNYNFYEFLMSHIGFANVHYHL